MSTVDKESITEGKICFSLNAKYAGNCKYKVANIYAFKDDWECDFFVQKQNGYTYEFEIKISRSDFFADKKKTDKHQILQAGKYNHIYKMGKWNHETKKTDWQEIIEVKEYTLRPNKFFYVVPEGMITVDEIPKYAGLMYYNQTHYEPLFTVREAPFIHREKLDLSKRLCKRFYYYWIDAKIEIRQLENEIDRLKNKIASNEHNLYSNLL